MAAAAVCCGAGDSENENGNDVRLTVITVVSCSVIFIFSPTLGYRYTRQKRGYVTFSTTRTFL